MYPNDHYAINIQDRSEQLSALHWAVAGNSTVATAMLLEAGADSTVMDSQGRTVFNYSFHYNAPACIGEILKYRPEAIGQRDTLGCTVLHLAAGRNGVQDIAISLLKHPFIDVNVADIRLRSPLHWAATYNHADLITLLLHKGARQYHRDIHGRLPVELAIAKGNAEAVTALEGGGEAYTAAMAVREADPEHHTNIKKQSEESVLLKRFSSVVTVKVSNTARFKPQDKDKANKKSKACVIA